MAKDNWHSWGQTLAIVLGMALAAGGYIQVQRETSKDVAENKADIKEVAVASAAGDEHIKQRIRSMELNQQKLIAIQENNNTHLSTISAGIKTNATSIHAIQLDVAATKTYVQTLEGVD